MNLELIWVSTGNTPWLKSAVELYEEKISHFCKFKVTKISLRGHERADAEINKKNEAKEILKRIDEKTYAILFDEKGSQSNSLNFSKELSKSIESNKQKVVFIIGGSFGVAEEVKAKVQKVISLGSLTFSHHVAVVVALEQIYRAWNIRLGRPYHNI